MFSDVAQKLEKIDEPPYNSNVIMLIALLKEGQDFAEEDMDESEIVLESEDKVVKNKFEADRKYATHAINIYVASWKWTWDEIANAMEIKVDDILYTWFDDNDEDHCPKFMLLLDHDLKSVVLVIRGTFSFNDIVMDVVCEEVEFQEGFAHKGFLDGSKVVLDKCHETLETAVSSFPGYGVVVCGHSMGGATAALVTMQLLQYHHLDSVRCIALGSPPVFRAKDGQIDRNIVENTNIYVNSQDVVPSLSFGSVVNLMAMLRMVDRLGMSLEEKVGVLMGSDGALANTKKIRSCVKDVKQDKFPFLHHPGEVIKMTGGGDQVKLERMTVPRVERMVSSIRIDETMITDHLYTKYEDIFRIQN